LVYVPVSSVIAIRSGDAWALRRNGSSSMVVGPSSGAGSGEF
jgi:hypothetical protein